MSAAIQTSPWIINRRQDLTWFIGGSLVAYGFLAIALAQGGLPLRLMLLWAFCLDGPHVFSTLTRILIDPHERRRTGKLWLLLFALPIAAVTAILTTGYGVIGIAVLTWGNYHIFKQHMGFVFLFKRKAREHGDFGLDKYFTLVSMFLPYAYFAIAYITGSTRFLPLFVSAGFVITAYYAWHQMQLPRRNVPKLLLLAVYIPLHWAVFVWAAIGPDPKARFMTMIVITNIGHSFQYLRLMWFHNNNRYADRPGVLGLISRKWIYFWAACFMLALPTKFVPSSGLLVAIFPYTIVVFHYITDGRIWRVRGDKELAAALRL